jgi:opacity protein-like surface antigen
VLRIDVRALLPAILLAALVAVLVAAPATAKEGVEATLTAPLPLDAPPGEEITVAWTLAAEEDGKREPFGAEGIYVRLVSATDGESTIGEATGSADGGYTAAVRVPEGGIGGVQIGLRGWASDATGTHPSDAFFPITNNPLPAVTDTTPAGATAEPASAAPTANAPAGDGGGSAVWIAGLALAHVLALAGAGVVVQRRRRGPRPASA